MEVVDFLQQPLNPLVGLVILLRSKVLIAKCPVVSAATLFEIGKVLVVSPGCSVGFGLAPLLKALLHHLWFHVKQHRIGFDFVRLRMLEISVDNFLLQVSGA